MTTATDDEMDRRGLPCEPGLICPSHVEIEDLTARLAAAESLLTDDGPEGRRVTNAQHVALRDRAARAEAALREIALMCANGYYGPDGHDYATEAKRVARAALAGQEVGR